MNKTMSKDFSKLHDQYSFFQTNSTEATEDIVAHMPYFQRIASKNLFTRVLDFGCGDGRFIADLLSKINLHRERFFIYLLDPDAKYLERAKKNISNYTNNRILQFHGEEMLYENFYEIILANHSLYYVKSIEATMLELCSILAEDGTLLASMAGKKNALEKYTIDIYKKMNWEYPFWVSDDLLSVLRKHKLNFELKSVIYKLSFHDTVNNRLSLAKFLIGDRYSEISEAFLLDPFDEFSVNGRVSMELSHEHIVHTKSYCNNVSLSYCESSQFYCL